MSPRKWIIYHGGILIFLGVILSVEADELINMDNEMTNITTEKPRTQHVPLLDENDELVPDGSTNGITDTLGISFASQISEDPLLHSSIQEPESTNDEWLTNEGSGDSSQPWTTSSPSCFSTPCNNSQLKIHQKAILKIPEGSNLTTICQAQESAELLWYRNNGEQLLSQTSWNDTLRFHLFNAASSDSGIYACVRIGYFDCCSMEFRLSVYPMPRFKLQILIASLVVAAICVVCLLLCVWRTRSLRHYSKKFDSARNNKELLLLS